MTNRERVRAAVRRERVDRVPMNDSFWDETVDAWRSQGHLPAHASLRDFFGFEWQLVHFDSGFMFEVTEVEESDTHITRRDSYGARARFQKGRSAPAEMLDYPVKNRADWEELKPRLHWHPDRFGMHGFYAFSPYWQPLEKSWERKADSFRQARASDDFIALYMYDAFEATWRRMGHERAFFMASDLALRTGPMLSPRMHKELCCPALTRLCDFLHARDVQLIYHCDGDFRPLLPNLVEAGVDCIQPLEVNAGMDVRELKRDYGDRLAFMGNIGHDEMLLPDDEMEAVIADKVRTAADGGGYLYHSDHSVAPDGLTEQQQRLMAPPSATRHPDVVDEN